MVYDIAVIGGGPAGASAALLAAKAGKKTLLIDADKGMTRRAMVYNFYGVPEIRGPDLVDTGHRQATRFGAELIKASVTDVRRTEEGFRLATEQGDFDARQVILATGATADLAAKIGLATRPATEPHIKTVLVVDPAGRTSKRGIWAAGTVAGTSVHVAVTSGDGARVVINLISEGNGARWVDHDVLKVNREDEQHHETGRTPQSTADIVAK